MCITWGTYHIDTINACNSVDKCTTHNVGDIQESINCLKYRSHDQIRCCIDGYWSFSVVFIFIVIIIFCFGLTWIEESIWNSCYDLATWVVTGIFGHINDNILTWYWKVYLKCREHIIFFCILLYFLLQWTAALSMNIHSLQPISVCTVIS